MSEEGIPTYIPGDLIEYFVQFTSPTNIREVTATFRNEATGVELALRGVAQLTGEEAIGGTRTQQAHLFYDEGSDAPPEPGRYRLARLEAETYGGKLLDFDNPPDEEAFLFEDEPDDPQLPRILQPTGFIPEEGHPDHPDRPPYSR
jgi:hypothetical protein